MRQQGRKGGSDYNNDGDGAASDASSVALVFFARRLVSFSTFSPFDLRPAPRGGESGAPETPAVKRTGKGRLRFKNKNKKKQENRKP